MSKKSNKLTVEQRIATVAHWLLQGFTSSEIISNVQKNWQVSTRQANTYINKATEMLATDTDKELKDAKAFHLRARLKAYQELLEEEKRVKSDASLNTYRRAIAIAALKRQISDFLKDMAKIEGLYIERVDISGELKQEVGYVLPDGSVISLG